MATEGKAIDQEWGALAELGDEEREARMLQRYQDLIAKPETEQGSQMLAMVQAEYALSDEQLRPFTISRLRVWLLLEAEGAKPIAALYDAAMLQMPGPQAMRQVGLVQKLAREFSGEDQERLVALVPKVFAGAPVGAVAQTVRRPPPPPQAPKRGWWPFGRR